MLGTLACVLPCRRGMLSACSKPAECVASLISLEILTGKTTSMIFCGMLPPPLASEGPRHDGLIENSRELECSSSFDHLQFLLGILLRDNSG